jgi:hypothetical protein
MKGALISKQEAPPANGRLAVGPRILRKVHMASI